MMRQNPPKSAKIRQLGKSTNRRLRLPSKGARSMNLPTTVIAHERSIFHWVGDTVYYAAWDHQVACFGDALC